MKKGYYGVYGGRFIPEILYRALIELEKNFKLYRNDIAFNREYKYYLTNYIGRPTPLYYAERLSAHFGNSNKIFFKREDLCHTGSHKLNNALGQALLALKLGKTRLIAETGAGQHGVATATVAALFGLKCSVYMGKVDIERQAMNVARMKLLGAEVAAVDTGNMTLKDAVNEALKDWVSSYKNTHYVIGSVIGPYPYPEMVAHFQKVIGSETYNQFKKLKLKKKYPDTLIACVGAGSNAIGLFKYFIDKKVNCKYIGVEAAGMGLTSGEHSAKLLKGEPGVLHGTYTYILQDSSGQI
ncbi:MAG TPA: tryptophan synthase subunit beta, partial [bacterium]|nr:tryptophan synthase subunit beta [bacterium]